MTLDKWNDILLKFPHPHILQTIEWAEQKKEVGWSPEPLIIYDDENKPAAAALILTRSIRPLKIGPSFSVCYIPRGPLVDWQNAELRNKVLESIESYCRKRKAIFIKIDPEVDLGTGVPRSTAAQENSLGQELAAELTSRGWRFSNEQVQFKNTVLIDLTGSEEDWMSCMKQKTRYNIRLAQRSGVTIRRGGLAALSLLYQMYAQTAARDGFIIREENYYLRLWKNFIDAGFAIPLIAEVEGEAVAALMLFVFGDTAWYFYGMSTTKQRDKMPNYLLQWEAMRIAKSVGCTIYDLWGAPDTFEGADSMSGVFRFKEGLGGVLHRTIGAWDFPNRPLTYFVYQGVLHRILNVTRWIRRGAIKKEVL